MKQELWASLFSLFALIGAANVALAETAETALDAEVSEKNLAAFDMVWERVRDTHWDPELGGVDWDQAKEDLRPSQEEAADTDEVRLRITKMLLRLKASHFGIIPREFYEDDGEEKDDQGWAGIEIRFIDEKPFITSVKPESPAADAGLKAGLEILAVDNRDAAEIMKIEKDVDIDEKVRRQAQLSKITDRLNGQVGEVVKMDVRDPSGRQLTYELTSVKFPGQYARFGNLPPMPMEIETKVLENGIAYLRFSIFLDPPRLMPTVRQFFAEQQEAPGLIIDLRGNPGGLGALSGAIAGLLAVEDQGSLGSMRTRSGELKFVFLKQPKSFTGPVAILIDEQSASTSEIFAGGMQYNGRAQIFGRTSPGMALPSMIEKLPNGDRFIHAFADFSLPNGNAVEGAGVTPQHPINLSPEALANGVDQDIEAASSWLLAQ